MRTEDPDKIPKEIKEEHLRRKQQGMNLHVAKTLHKSKIAELVQALDKIEQAGDPGKIRAHLLEIEAEKLYGDLLLHRQSLVAKQYALSCEAYNHALARSSDCYGCKHLRAENNDPVRFCGYIDTKWTPITELEKCPDPGGLMFDHDLPPIYRHQELPDHGRG